MMGIIIGVAAVIVLVALGNGMKAHFNEQFSRLANQITITPTSGTAPGGGVAHDLTDRDVDALTDPKTAPDIASVSPSVAGTVTLVASADGHRPSAVPVEVSGQGTTQCDVELRAGGRLKGTVRAGVGNTPLGDARVALINAAGNTVATTTTSPAGEYTFTDLDQGEYTVTASAYRPATSTMTIDGADQAMIDLRLDHPDE